MSPTVCSRNIEHDKCQETLYWGPQGNWTFIVQMIRSFFWDIGGQ